MRRIALTALMLITVQFSFGQFVVEQDYTIEEYVNEILLGSGITATNVTYYGDEEQLGFITDNSDPQGFPMDGGLLLCTDHAAQNEIGGTGGFAGQGMFTDNDLLDIANSVPDLIGQSFNVSDINDGCILEFDFTAIGDTVSFNYVFASDEWSTYINSSFNDVFAFFLSGPGISGPYDSPPGFPDGAVNIAYLPDTDPELPITISSVHAGNPNGTDCFNCEYYNWNAEDDGFTIEDDINIRAYTTKLTAWHQVECGETYHIKLAIADGSDGALKSTVILEEGSFVSNSVVQVDLSIDVGGPDANTIYEDCGEATLTFSRPIETVLEAEEMVIIEYSGTAEMGIDFSELPDTVLFEPFVQSLSYTVDAFIDGIPEGTENVQMEMLNLAACNDIPLTSYFEFFIADEPEPLVVDDWEIEICEGDTIEVFPVMSGGYGNFHYDWSNGETTESIIVSPDATTTYNLIVSDTCGMPSDDGDYTVAILEVPPLEVVIDQGDFEVDCGGFMDLSATASGGDGNYSDWYWYDDEGLNLWGWQNTLFYSAWNGAEQVNVEVTDGCGFTATATVDVTMNVPELILDYEDMTVLCNEDFTVDPGVSGGSEPYFFSWTVNGIVDWNIWTETYTTSTSEDMTFSINVSDNCGQNEVADINVTVESPEIFIEMPDPMEGTCVTEFDIMPEVSGGSGGFVYGWTEDGSLIGENSTLSYVPGETTVIDFTVEDQCNQSASDQIEITIINPPVEVNVGEDVDASCIDVTEITADVTSGSGGYVYQWVVNGQTVGSDETLDWQSYETVQVAVNVVDACNEQGSDDMIINIPDIPLEIWTSEDVDVCQFEEVELLVSADGGEGFFSYDWLQLPGTDTSQIVAPGETTIYEVIATDLCGEQISDFILVTVHPVDVGYGQTYETASSVQYTSVVFPDCEDCTYDYLWDFGDGSFSNEENPLHQYDGISSYSGSLIVTNELGCQDSTDFNYTPPVSLYIPNTFTPNNDGINDFFRVHGDGIESFEILVYNRWGEVVYHSTDINEIWLGNTKENGEYYAINNTYNYLVKIKGFNTEAFEQTGTINVIR